MKVRIIYFSRKNGNENLTSEFSSCPFYSMFVSKESIERNVQHDYLSFTNVAVILNYIVYVFRYD